MQQKRISTLTALAFAATLALSACGGGGGSGNGDSAPGSSTPSTDTGNSGSAPDSSSATTGNVSMPQYANDSAKLAVFNTINAQRQQCGFPALTENTLLDQAAQAHASYMGQNGGTITDSEASGNTGFTGTTYADRAVKAGYPNSSSVGGFAAGLYTNATLSEQEYGEQVAYEWLSGVYHIQVATLPLNQIGIGWNELTFNGYPEIQAAVTVGNWQMLNGNLPLTFPCEGSTNLPYASNGEMPTPPNTSGAWGAPVAVSGNSGDKIVMQSGTMTDNAGTVITLQVLDSTNDPNKLLPPSVGVAYPASPLKPNTPYAVSLTGTYNGKSFSRTFTFTTDNTVG